MSSPSTATTAEASSDLKQYYPIGKPGVAWGDAEKEAWKKQTVVQRSYQTDVLDVLSTVESGDGPWKVLQYGELPIDPKRYPLMACTTREPSSTGSQKPLVLVTGGTHGYEMSGVKGAIKFITQEAANPHHTKHFDIVVCPCLSPWSYEHNQRWQPDLQDPNRSFKEGKWLPESAALRDFVRSIASTDDASWMCHLDLHETTDTDATEFMPARAAYNGEKTHKLDIIPDGFYLVADLDKVEVDFQKAVIESVKQVTHIAPPDADGKIIDEPVLADIEGVIAAPSVKLGLCMSLTGATYATTTEVYPDSPKVTDGDCDNAQIAAVRGALDHIMKIKGLS